MEIVPVIDVKHGQAVHAVAGDRCNYQPIESQLVEGSDCVALASRFREMGFANIYVADLDSLVSGQPPNLPLGSMLTGSKVDIMLDANWFDFPESLESMNERSRPILSLETASSLQQLRSSFERARSSRPIFSMDFLKGELFTNSTELRNYDPFKLVEQIFNVGFRELIVLEIARVGTESGPAMIDMIVAIKKRWPTLSLISGGGIRSADDLAVLEDSGCDRALVGTALHQLKLGIEHAAARSGNR